MFTNKGFSNILIYSVLSSLALIIIAIWLIGVKQSGEDLIENQCAEEVIAHAFSLRFAEVADNIPFGGGVKILSPNIKCPTKYETVNGNEENVKEKLAKDLVKCWETWGKGELELFKQEEGVFCHICSVFEFENEFEINDFFTYMVTEKDGSEIYLQKITPYSSENLVGIANDIENSDPNVFPVIDTSNDYATIFKYIKGEDTIIAELDSEPVLKTNAFVVGAAGAKLGAAACSIIPGAGTFTCGAVGLTLGAGIGGILYFFAEQTPQVFSYIALIPYTEQGLTDLNCEISPAEQQ